MKTRYKILNTLLLLIVVATAAIGYTFSRTAACEPAPALAAGDEPMKAVTYRCYGSPDVLQYGDVAMPAIADDQLLVRVHAAGVNPLDWHYMRGTPYIMRAESGFGKPSDPRLGVDFAGTVEAVGKNVTRFKPGDSVFGGAAGAFAEYVRVRESGAVALMPENVSFDEAGTVAIAALTALQGLRDKGGLEAGQRVLINGASGGVGTFAVQIAKAMGAEVTGVCSTRNVEMVRALGADHVIDYKKQNFTETGKTYDLILDNVGSQSLGDTRRALEADGTLVLVGSTSSGNWLGPLMRPLQAYVTSPFVSENLIMLLAVLNREDLETLAAMMRSDEVTPVIDRRYALSDVADAIRYSETGRARGKIVIDVL